MHRLLPLLAAPLILTVACEAAEVGAAVREAPQPAPSVATSTVTGPSQPPAAPSPTRRMAKSPAPSASPTPTTKPSVQPITEVAARRVERPTPTSRTLLFGDSIGGQAASYLRGRVPQFSSATAGGTALCDWVDSGLYARQIAEHKPTTVVLSFNGNNFTPCVKGLTGSRLAAAYSQSAKEAIFLAHLQNVQRVIIVRGPISGRSTSTGLSSRAVMDGWTVQPGATISWAGKYVPADGYLWDGVHLNGRGAAAYARGIAASL